jgi:5-methylthioadenosine/S-adenosylhomocysteine deaminase
LTRRMVRVTLSLLTAGVIGGWGPSTTPSTTSRAILLEGTVVTMNAAHDVIRNGRVLVRGERIVAVWSGERPPEGVDLANVPVVSAGRNALVFPGLINLHDHPSFDVLPLWVPPVQPEPLVGRTTGHEAYDNRYQWNTTSPPEYQRLVASPQAALNLAQGLGLANEVLEHAEVRAVLGGQTAMQGELPLTAAGLMVRDVDHTDFGSGGVATTVSSVEDPAFAAVDAPTLRQGMAGGSVSAWLVHLAEGVRDGDRLAGDAYSSRHELDTIQQLGLLTDATVILHGTALERADFAAMRAAPAARASGGDGLGAKLVWTPTGNLLLYGRTANVYDALAEGVTVSLGTDWTADGSNTLLDELKAADIALRDPRILGSLRAEVPALADDEMLDRVLVDMVTRNPARTMRWANLGSIEPGKFADLVVLHRPHDSPTNGMPESPYRSLIDATEQDVHLVLVDGDPVAGDTSVMQRLTGARMQVVQSTSGRVIKGIDIRRPGGAETDIRLTDVEQTLRDALHALGGDGAAQASGPPPASATFSYLRTHIAGGRYQALADDVFRDTVLAALAGRVNGRINLERIELGPLLTSDDHFFFSIMGGQAVEAPRRLAADPPDLATAPYRPYPWNLNQTGARGNPFAPELFVERWYDREH